MMNPTHVPRITIVRRSKTTGIVLCAALTLVACDSKSDHPVAVQAKAQGGTATTMPIATPRSEGPRVGGRLTVLAATLPSGVRFLEELPRNTDAEETLIARFAATTEGWSGDGPYLRLVFERDAGLGERLEKDMRPLPVEIVSIGETTGFYLIDESTNPRNFDLPGKLGDLRNSWTRVDWAIDADRTISVQAKGISKDDLVEIAQEVQFDA